MKKIILITALALALATTISHATAHHETKSAQSTMLARTQVPQYGKRCVNDNQCANFERCTGYPGVPGVCVPK